MLSATEHFNIDLLLIGLSKSAAYTPVFMVVTVHQANISPLVDDFSDSCPYKKITGW